MGEPDRGICEPQTAITFWCARGHHTSPSFASTAAIPTLWECPHCGQPAGRDRAAPPEAITVLRKRSHLTYVHERRDVDAGEALLEEALAKLRARRGA